LVVVGEKVGLPFSRGEYLIKVWDMQKKGGPGFGPPG